MEEFQNLSLSIDNAKYTMINISNMSREDLDFEQVKMMVDMFSTNNNVLSDTACTIIIIIYTVLVIIAVCGNSAVMMAVLRRKEMRTARNIFMFNLALSDLLMALSIPFTVMDGLTRTWNLPNSLLGCR